jgi:hypothetical protein
MVVVDLLCALTFAMRRMTNKRGWSSEQLRGEDSVVAVTRSSSSSRTLYIDITAT